MEILGEFFGGLVLVIALPWIFFAWRGCSTTEDRIRYDLSAEMRGFEDYANNRRASVAGESAKRLHEMESSFEARKSAVLGELADADKRSSTEIARLEKAVELRSRDKEFRRTVNRRMSKEYKEYLSIVADLAEAGKLLSESDAVVAAGKGRRSDEILALAARTEKAKASLDRVGRAFLEAAALLQVEERQFAP